MKRQTPRSANLSHKSEALRRLGWSRYSVCCFLRFSERIARMCGITPQLLLGVAGYTDRGWATISELAEFLQERYNAVVGLWSSAPRNTA